jgi:hypothetical protein
VNHNQIHIELAAKFEKEFAKYLKKYRSLNSDFEVLQRAIKSTPTGDKSKHWVILRQQGNKYLLKVRMMCRALKGSQFRVIYFYGGEKIELVFIEIYFKGKKEREDQPRIDEFWKARVETHCDASFLYP